jgi:hypothetical protein
LIEQRLEACLHELAIVDAAAAQPLKSLARPALELGDRELHFVAQDLCLQSRIRRVGRPVAWLVPRDHLFDLAHALVLRRRDPLVLGFRRDDARELTRTRERQVALIHRLAELGHLFDHLRDAQPFDRRALRVAHLSLHVLDKARAAIRTPEHQLLRFSQCRALLRVQRTARLHDALERAMHALALLLVIASSRSPCPRTVIHFRSVTQHRFLSCSRRSR